MLIEASCEFFIISYHHLFIVYWYNITIFNHPLLVRKAFDSFPELCNSFNGDITKILLDCLTPKNYTEISLIFIACFIFFGWILAKLVPQTTSGTNNFSHNYIYKWDMISFLYFLLKKNQY